MQLFKQRETLIQNITYMAIMAAINVVFTLLTTLVPALMFLIIFVLPLCSTIVALFCKKRYYPIYALVTIGLCALVTMWNISDTLFYVIPSICTGFIFAILTKAKMNGLWMIIITAIIHVAFSFAFIPLINLMYGRNFIQDFANIFGLGNYKYLQYVVIAAVLTISIIQSAFSYMVIKDEIKKFGFEICDQEIKPLFLGVAQLILCLLMVLAIVIYQPLSFAILILIILVGVYSFVCLFSHMNIFTGVALAVSLFASIFLFAIFYKNIPAPLSILLVGIFFLLSTIIGIVNNYLFIKPKEKSKIEK